MATVSTLDQREQAQRFLQQTKLQMS